jgi:hypothetical protein
MMTPPFLFFTSQRSPARSVTGEFRITPSPFPLPVVGGEDKKREGFRKKPAFINKRTEDHSPLILPAVVLVTSIPIQGNFGSPEWVYVKALEIGFSIVCE